MAAFHSAVYQSTSPNTCRTIREGHLLPLVPDIAILTSAKGQKFFLYNLSSKSNSILYKATRWIYQIQVLTDNFLPVEHHSKILHWETFLTSETSRTGMSSKGKNFRFSLSQTFFIPKQLAAFRPSAYQSTFF